MLIHLDSSATTDAASESDTSELSRRCIGYLLVAHFDGAHVVSLDPDDIAAMLKPTLDWSREAVRALRHIDANYAQIAGLRHDVPWSLELGVGASFDGTARDVINGKTVIRAKLHDFNRQKKAADAVLLGENRTDADLFIELGRLMRAARGWDGIAMVHAPRGGGGHNTAIEFRGVADEGRILLAIGDTDKRHPTSGIGDTYSKLEEAARGRPAYQRARPLPVRTAEGLVPLEVYKEALTSPERLGSVDRLKQLLRSAPNDVLRYAHIKDGIRLYQVEYSKNEDEREYWSTIAKDAGRDQCNRSAREECKTREECGCYVVDALGGDALPKVVAWMKAKHSKKRLVTMFGLTRGNKSDLADLGDEVLAWGLALAPLD